ncbi:hypothetical protein bpr_I1515 [Butyrivibrio proteoclasticus B316]|uniref:DUF4956 domain-containing protein n=1 Tax=Butyrivibrio proteoclasticus (strain ATCC 51982 / DSM 14932 / B316) TaxID=515622 RepID=E0RWF4_BUTPB|nr:DUF4956 domain-containing protein [Butyrivibrio proteoclasticus]ADL34252.1 hypothetical protein bpr_I1515 [Butyrivibrio proteoclasticus B316]
MKSTIFNFLSTSNTAMSYENVLLNFVAATIIGLVIFLCYKLTHSRAVYSAKFNVSLLMMTVITTLVMSVIGNNIALSLGMVGALSIVRFRTAIKDVRDTAYIFWCIAVGICCGVSEYFLVGVGSLVIFLVLLLLGAVHSDDVYLISVKADRNAENDISMLMTNAFRGKANMRVNNSNSKSCELIYEVTGKMLKKKVNGQDIKEELYNIDSVSMVNIICQSEEISR